MSRTRWVPRRDRSVATEASRSSPGNPGGFSSRDSIVSIRNSSGGRLGAVSAATLLRPATFCYQSRHGEDDDTDFTAAGGRVIGRSGSNALVSEEQETEEEEGDDDDDEGERTGVEHCDEVEDEGQNSEDDHDDDDDDYSSPPHASSPGLERGPTEEALAAVRDEASSFMAYLPPEIEDTVVAMTNLEASRRRPSIDGWKPMGHVEFRAYVGLLILAGVYRSRGEACESLWDAESGRSVLRATMPLKTFRAYSSALRFNDRETREARRRDALGRYEKLAPVRAVWDEWCRRFALMYQPGPEVTVDERLVPFRGLNFIRHHVDTELDEASTNSSLPDEDDFFGSTGKPEAGELERYLSCPFTGGVDLFYGFSHIKKLSIKINTALPASGACEGLFSQAGLLFTAQQLQRHSKNLESKLLLKLNHHFTE